MTHTFPHVLSVDDAPFFQSRKKRESFSLFTGNVKLECSSSQSSSSEGRILFGQQSFKRFCARASFVRKMWSRTEKFSKELNAYREVISRDYSFPDISQSLSYMLFLYAYLRGNIVMFFKQFLSYRNNSRSQKWRLACDQLLVKEGSKRNCRFEVSILSRA